MTGPLQHLSSRQRILLLVATVALAPLPARAATVRGSVIDPDGRVVSHAHVLVLAQAVVIASTDTDDRGTFVVAGLPGGAYTIDVALDGFRSEPVSVQLAPDGDRAVSLRLRLSAVTESIVVSAAQVDLPRSRAPASVTVITRAELDARQTETVADALAHVPGLAVARGGGRGAITAVFPRGGESNYTLVLIDGVPMNAFGGDFDFAHLPVADVERIEVVRGPQSAIYGGGAIGAVVQIVTRHGGAPRVEASTEAGAFRTWRATLATAGERAGWGWGFAAERLASDGFEGTAAATGERVSNDDYRASHVTVSGSWAGPRRTEIRTNLRVEANERGFPGPFGSDPAGTFGGVDRVSRGENTTRTYAIGGAFDLTHRWRPAALVSYADFDGTFTSPFGESISGTGRLDARLQADWHPRAPLGLSLGAEFVRERAESTYITDQTFDPIPVRRSVVGPFVEVRVEHDERLLIVAGLRTERIHRDALAGDANSYPPRPDFAPDTRVATTPRLSASFFLQPARVRAAGWTKLHTSAAAGIRPPDAFEIAFTDNPALQPERSRTVDAGVEQAVLGGRLVIDATAFFNRYDDLIVAVSRSIRDASRFSTDNISNARARGLEFAASVRPIGGVEAGVTYTFVDSQILAVDGVPGQAPLPFSPGDPLLRRPRHQASLDVAMRHGRVSAFLRVGGRGRMLDVEPTLGALAGLFTAPGYVVADAGGSVSVASGLEVFGRVTNLFDRRYEETLGYPALPRSAMVGVRVAAHR
jgi:outer membrane cobalamin receptor